MEFSLKESFGMMVALLCTTLVIYALYNVGFFKKIVNFINSSSDSDIVEVKDPAVPANPSDDNLDE